MLALIILSITAAVVAVPCVGLLFLVDASINPPQNAKNAHATICLRNSARPSARCQDAGVLVAG